MLVYTILILVSHVLSQIYSIEVIFSNNIVKNICKINDNYCDCGYDEPNTDACSGYQPHYFQCLHQKYSIELLPYSRVNDGIAY